MGNRYIILENKTVLEVPMTEYVVAKEDELSDGERVLVELEGRDIAVFQIDEEYYAYTNWCPHQGGPCCEGGLGGTLEGTYDKENLSVELTWTKEGEILSCPWHEWEYDILTGDCLSRNGIKLPSHSIEVENGEIKVRL